MYENWLQESGILKTDRWIQLQGSWGLCGRELWAVANKGGLRLESKRSGDRMVSTMLAPFRWKTLARIELVPRTSGTFVVLM